MTAMQRAFEIARQNARAARAAGGDASGTVTTPVLPQWARFPEPEDAGPEHVTGLINAIGMARQLCHPDIEQHLISQLGRYQQFAGKPATWTNRPPDQLCQAEFPSRYAPVAQLTAQAGPPAPRPTSPPPDQQGRPSVADGVAPNPPPAPPDRVAAGAWSRWSDGRDSPLSPEADDHLSAAMGITGWSPRQSPQQQPSQPPGGRWPVEKEDLPPEYSADGSRSSGGAWDRRPDAQQQPPAGQSQFYDQNAGRWVDPAWRPGNGAYDALAQARPELFQGDG